MSRRRYIALIVAALLLGAALRTFGVSRMLDMAHYDEAYYAVDALSLIEQPRLAPFFPDNFGRESLWMYVLTPALSIFGAGAFALRVTALLTGVLTLATVARLARELLGRRAAVWPTLALAALFLHVLMSHLAYRALLFPFIGALAWALLWRARQTNRLLHWVLAGAALGIVSYTYFAARGWIALALIMLVVWYRGARRDRRRGLATMVVIAGMISLPLIAYLVTMPSSGARFEQVIVPDAAALLANVGAWIGAWVTSGSQDVMFNLPGRPILDAPLAVLAVLGLIGLARWRRRGVWIVALGIVSVLPALLTTEPLRWLRAIGVVVPLALMVGIGADFVRRLRPRWAWIVPAALIGWAGVNTIRDFDAWVGSPDLFMPMEQHLYRGLDLAAEIMPSNAPIYFLPFTRDHPVLRLREWRLGERPIGAFRSADCLVLSDLPVYYFAVLPFEPEIERRLARWTEITTVYQEPHAPPRYAIFRAAAPSLDAVERGAVGEDITATFGNLLRVQLAERTASTVVAGDLIDVTVALRRGGEIERSHTVFLHLYPQDETRLLSQVDRPLCLSHPPDEWRSDETIFETYALPVPADLAGGTYRIALGIYDSQTLDRLEIDGQNSVLIVGTVRIGDG